MHASSTALVMKEAIISADAVAAHPNRAQILIRQTFKALPAGELINLTSYVGRFLYRRCLKCPPHPSDHHGRWKICPLSIYANHTRFKQ